MKLLSKLKEGVLKFDLFCTTEYFRYRQEPEYRTLTGGVCSIIIIIVFIIVFSSSVFSTFNKQTLVWQYGLTQQTSNQFQIKTNTDTDSKFMFALGVNGLDLTLTPQYFNFSLSQQTSIKGQVQSINYTLQPCKRQNWLGAGTKILQIYDRLNFSSYLCPPINHKFNITGMKSSQTWKYLKITISQCNDPLICAPNTTLIKYLQNHTNFNFNIYFINALINPSASQEISYYLEDRNFVPFNYNYGGEVNLYMSKYQVLTDQQILPFNDIKVSTGGIVNNVGQYLASRKFGTEFATINIKKSSLSINIQREYIKLDSALSYIGGLFGFIIIFFVFMKIYTEYSYEIEMGDQLYFYDKRDPLNSQKFNFITFIAYVFYQFIGLFGCNFQWNLMKKYGECRQQIQKQFDISFLMKRLIFLERSLRVLFQDHQFKGLHLHQKLTLKEAQQLRSFYKLRDKLDSILIEEVSDSNQDGKQTTKKQSEDSNLVNVTENVLANNQQIRHEDSSNFDQYTSNFPKKSIKVKNKSEIQMNQHQKKEGLQNQSEAMIRPLTTMRHKQRKSSELDKKNSAIQRKIKLLQKQSLSGNKISKKIYEGFSTDLIKNILLKIEEANDEQESPQKNQIVINENEDQFQIRISKRVVRPRMPSFQQQPPKAQSPNNPNSPIHIEDEPANKQGNNKVHNEFEYLH